MEKFQSLAEVLGVPNPKPVELQDQGEPLAASVADIEDPTKFCQKILQSREFRQYIMNGIVLGDLPPAIVSRVMDHGWGKPPERHEHTGKDGKPIETISEVRRVIVRSVAPQTVDEAAAAAPRKQPPSVH